MEQTAPFTFDFALDGKAVVAAPVDGEGLDIEGYAAGFSPDREDEAFERGAFADGVDKYFRDNPILCYHHHYDQALGTVKEVRLDGKGLFVKAHLDAPEPGTNAADIFNKVKSGTIKGFSVGGIFKKRMTPKGPRIHKVDIAEISVTPLPMEPGSLFAVAGKAFGTDSELEDSLAALDGLLNVLDDLATKAVSAEKRENAKYTFDGTDKYPIDNKADLEKAIKLCGSSNEDKSKVQSYLIRVAKELGCVDCIPEDWLS